MLSCTVRQVLVPNVCIMLFCRWKSGVPGTLNKLVKNSVGDYVLSPWPSWDMQEVGASESLQNCQSMKIDSEGRMW